jgi:hypothetical protein
VKLTQGTGRGTCWWNNSILQLCYYFNVITIKWYIMDFFQNFFNYFDYKIFSIDELISILLFYNFFKLLAFSSLVELI